MRPVATTASDLYIRVKPTNLDARLQPGTCEGKCHFDIFKKKKTILVQTKLPRHNTFSNTEDRQIINTIDMQHCHPVLKIVHFHLRDSLFKNENLVITY